MKVNNETLEALKACMLKVLSANNYDSFNAVAEHYKKMGIGKDHARRCRWDLINASGQEGLNIILQAYNLGCNDDHIDTALKSITGIR